jgi:2-(1,2-epoxy-1,2-dihydrophenyl)acetyl-CoA isomerase
VGTCDSRYSCAAIHEEPSGGSISVAHWAAPPGAVSIASVRDDELYRQYETINVYRRGPGATLELNRPDRMNAWSNQFSRDLLVAIREIADDNGIRAVVVTGAGKAFSSGADLKEAADQAEGGTIDVYRVLTERYHPIITGIRRMPKPVVAAVNGPAVGIGLSLALACDLVVAAESAYFALAFVNIGLAPDGGSSLFVPSRVGFARAAELAMLGERLDARKALDWGLINRVWPDAEFAPNVVALLDQLASGPTKSYWGTKRQLDRWLYEQMENQLEFEAGIQQEIAISGDFAEGIAAFAEKRAPRFSGA